MRYNQTDYFPFLSFPRCFPVPFTPLPSADRFAFPSISRCCILSNSASSISGGEGALLDFFLGDAPSSSSSSSSATVLRFFPFFPLPSRRASPAHDPTVRSSSPYGAYFFDLPVVAFRSVRLVRPRNRENTAVGSARARRGRGKATCVGRTTGSRARVRRARGA